MPEFLEDPSVLTKEKLKGELLANKVPLPSGEQKKEIYVKLYLKYLTARNKNPENFSSDEEAEPAAPVRNRIGRKATRKTDKPRPEEKEDLDVTEMSNEELKEQLIKNGVNPGPITTTTRKLYERRLQKLLEQGPAIKSSGSTPAPASTEDRKQNGNTDSDQYSDNEEETNPEPKVDKREPLKNKTKTPVTVRQRRFEHNQDNSIQDTVETPSKMSGSSKHVSLQSAVGESLRFSRRTPMKLLTSYEDNFEQDVAETPSKMSGSSEHVPLQSAVYESRLSRRTPMKLLTNYEGNSEQDTAETPSKMSGSSKHVPLQSEVGEYLRFSRRTPMKMPTNYEVIEKTEREERNSGKDVLREMFPYETLTPTGISATCRRPIKGAAGRPVELGEFKLEESIVTKSFTKVVPPAEIKVAKTKSRRSVPIWIQIVLLALVAVFLFLVYEAMEKNEGNPFTAFLGASETSNTAE